MGRYVTDSAPKTTRDTGKAGYIIVMVFLHGWSFSFMLLVFDAGGASEVKREIMTEFCMSAWFWLLTGFFGSVLTH